MTTNEIARLGGQMTQEVVRRDEPWKPFEVMDRADDELITRELKGEVIEELIYEYNDGGHPVVGLSKKGVDQVAKEMSNQGEVLRELDFQLIDGEGAITAVVKVGRYLVSAEGVEQLLDVKYGVKHQPKMMTLRGGGTKADPFYVEKAMMKAARNASRRLMPETLIARVIEMAREHAKSKKLLGPAREEKPQPVGGAAVAEALAIEAAYENDSELPFEEEEQPRDEPEAPSGLGVCPKHNEPFKDGQYGPYHFIGAFVKGVKSEACNLKKLRQDGWQV